MFEKKKYNQLQRPFITKLKYLALQSISTKKRTFLTLAIVHAPIVIFAFMTHPQLTNLTISKSTQALSTIKIPKFLRNYLYSWYCKKYNVNQQEMVNPLEYYTTFQEFFTRKIKQREIKQGENIICAPADSKILSLREVTSDQCFVIKGYNYKFGQFICGQEVQFLKEDFNLLKKKASNKLYQAVFYLAPGDYHRFHTPTNYQVLKRKIIEGCLFSVSEESLLKGKKVYQKNARLVLHGKWKQGYLGMVMVGALNVGKIVLSQKKSFNKGQEMGYFSIGSTIVLFIQAQNLNWKTQQGKKIKYGQELASILIQKPILVEEKNNQKSSFSIIDFFKRFICM